MDLLMIRMNTNVTWMKQVLTFALKVYAVGPSPYQAHRTV